MLGACCWKGRQVQRVRPRRARALPVRDGSRGALARRSDGGSCSAANKHGIEGGPPKIATLPRKNVTTFWTFLREHPGRQALLVVFVLLACIARSQAKLWYPAAKLGAFPLVSPQSNPPKKGYPEARHICMAKLCDQRFGFAKEPMSPSKRVASLPNLPS